MASTTTWMCQKVARVTVFSSGGGILRLTHVLDFVQYLNTAGVIVTFNTLQAALIVWYVVCTVQRHVCRNTGDRV